MYKQFLSQDIIINPLTLNKGYKYEGLNNLTSSGIDFFIGEKITGSLFNPLTDPTTGYNEIKYQRLIYESIGHLYYSNYYSSSEGSLINRRILIPGYDQEGNKYVGNNYNPLYDNYLQTSIHFSKSYKDSNQIAVISVPHKLYGNFIQPKSFKLTSLDSGSFYYNLRDDGEGNILDSSNSTVGNIYYPHGIITIIPPIKRDIYGGYYFNFYEIWRGITITYTGSVSAITTGSLKADLQVIGYPNTGSNDFNLLYISSSGTGATASFVSGTSYYNWQVNNLLPALQVNPYINQYFNIYFYPSVSVDYLDNSSIVQGQSSSFYLEFKYPASASFPTGNWEGSFVLGVEISPFFGLYNNGYTQGTGFLTTNSVNILLNDVTCSFSSSNTIYDTQYKCEIRENEFNYSLNPSLIKNDSTGSLYDFVTGSYFSPYITTVGLYDDYQNLLAVAKLAQPLSVSPLIDTTILVNIDLT